MIKLLIYTIGILTGWRVRILYANFRRDQARKQSGNAFIAYNRRQR